MNGTFKKSKMYLSGTGRVLWAVLTLVCVMACAAWAQDVSRVFYTQVEGGTTEVYHVGAQAVAPTDTLIRNGGVVPVGGLIRVEFKPSEGYWLKSQTKTGGGANDLLFPNDLGALGSNNVREVYKTNDFTVVAQDITSITPVWSDRYALSGAGALVNAEAVTVGTVWVDSLRYGNDDGTASAHFQNGAEVIKYGTEVVITGIPANSATHYCTTFTINSQPLFSGRTHRVTGDVNVAASFVPRTGNATDGPYTITYARNTAGVFQYTGVGGYLSVVRTGAGANVGVGSGSQVIHGSVLEIRAIPGPGYKLVSMTAKNVGGTAFERNIPMRPIAGLVSSYYDGEYTVAADVELVAVWARGPYDLTVVTNGDLRMRGNSYEPVRPSSEGLRSKEVIVICRSADGCADVGYPTYGNLALGNGDTVSFESDRYALKYGSLIDIYYNVGKNFYELRDGLVHVGLRPAGAGTEPAKDSVNSVVLGGRYKVTGSNVVIGAIFDTAWYRVEIPVRENGTVAVQRERYNEESVLLGGYYDINDGDWVRSDAVLVVKAEPDVGYALSPPDEHPVYAGATIKEPKIDGVLHSLGQEYDVTGHISSRRVVIDQWFAEGDYLLSFGGDAAHGTLTVTRGRVEGDPVLGITYPFNITSGRKPKYTLYGSDADSSGVVPKGTEITLSYTVDPGYIARNLLVNDVPVPGVSAAGIATYTFTVEGKGKTLADELHFRDRVFHIVPQTDPLRFEVSWTDTTDNPTIDGIANTGTLHVVKCLNETCTDTASFPVGKDSLDFGTRLRISVTPAVVGTRLAVRRWENLGCGTALTGETCGPWPRNKAFGDVTEIGEFPPTSAGTDAGATVTRVFRVDGPARISTYFDDLFEVYFTKSGLGDAKMLATPPGGTPITITANGSARVPGATVLSFGGDDDTWFVAGAEHDFDRSNGIEHTSTSCTGTCGTGYTYTMGTGVSGKDEHINARFDVKLYDVNTVWPKHATVTSSPLAKIVVDIRGEDGTYSELFTPGDDNHVKQVKIGDTIRVTPIPLAYLAPIGTDDFEYNPGNFKASVSSSSVTGATLVPGSGNLYTVTGHVRIEAEVKPISKETITLITDYETSGSIKTAEDLRSNWKIEGVYAHQKEFDNTTNGATSIVTSTSSVFSFNASAYTGHDTLKSTHIPITNAAVSEVRGGIDSGTTVFVTVTPPDGYRLTRIEAGGDALFTGGSIKPVVREFVFDRPMTVLVRFERNSYNFKYSWTGPGSIDVISDKDGSEHLVVKTDTLLNIESFGEEGGHRAKLHIAATPTRTSPIEGGNYAVEELTINGIPFAQIYGSENEILGIDPKASPFSIRDLYEFLAYDLTSLNWYDRDTLIHNGTIELKAAFSNLWPVTWQILGEDGGKLEVTAAAESYAPDTRAPVAAGTALPYGALVPFGTELTVTATPKEGHRVLGVGDNTGNNFTFLPPFEVPLTYKVRVQNPGGELGFDGHAINIHAAFGEAKYRVREIARLYTPRPSTETPVAPVLQADAAYTATSEVPRRDNYAGGWIFMSVPGRTNAAAAFYPDVVNNTALTAESHRTLGGTLGYTVPLTVKAFAKPGHHLQSLKINGVEVLDSAATYDYTKYFSDLPNSFPALYSTDTVTHVHNVSAVGSAAGVDSNGIINVEAVFAKNLYVVSYEQPAFGGKIGVRANSAWTSSGSLGTDGVLEPGTALIYDGHGRIEIRDAEQTDGYELVSVLANGVHVDTVYARYAGAGATETGDLRDGTPLNLFNAGTPDQLAKFRLGNHHYFSATGLNGKVGKFAGRTGIADSTAIAGKDSLLVTGRTPHFVITAKYELVCANALLQARADILNTYLFVLPPVKMADINTSDAARDHVEKELLKLRDTTRDLYGVKTVIGGEAATNFKAATGGSPTSVLGDNGSYPFTVELTKDAEKAGYANATCAMQTAQRTLTINATPYDTAANTARIAAAKAAIEALVLSTVSSEVVRTQDDAATWVKSEIATLVQGIDHVVNITNFVAATDAVAAGTNGTAGSFAFTVSLTIDGNTPVAKTGITAAKNVAITPRAYNAGLDNADIAAAKAAIEARVFEVSMTVVNTAAAARTYVNSILSSMNLNGVNAVVVSPDPAGAFVAAQAGATADSPGIPGSYTFTVTLNKGGGTEATVVQTLAIVYDPSSADDAAITAARTLIQNTAYGTVSMTVLNTVDAARAYVLDSIIRKLPLDGVAVAVEAETFVAAVRGSPNAVEGTAGSYLFTVSLTRGAGTKQITEARTLGITATPWDPNDPSNADNNAITAARLAVFNAQYGPVSMDTVSTSEQAKAIVLGVINGLPLDGVTATITNENFTAATAGTVANPSGTNGSYTFTVELTRGIGDKQTAERTMTVVATPFVGSTVSVIRGTGGGTYGVGTTHTITAIPTPADSQFVNWTNDAGVVVSTAPSFAYTVTAANVTLTANFAPILYTVTVYGGRGSGSYARNSTVTITSGTPAKGERFKGWTTNDGLTFTPANAGKTTFTMPNRNVTVTAVFAPYTVPKFVVPTAQAATGKTSIFVSGDPVAKANLAIFDATGNLVRKVSIADDAQADEDANRAVAEWDYRDSKGKPVAAGTYLLKGSVKTADGKTSKVSVLFGVK